MNIRIGCSDMVSSALSQLMNRFFVRSNSRKTMKIGAMPSSSERAMNATAYSLSALTSSLRKPSIEMTIMLPMSMPNGPPKPIEP
ncbi:MAG: hypothetical protein WDN72_02850 [Alphaproteobacteria bacterium]